MNFEVEFGPVFHWVRQKIDQRYGPAHPFYWELRHEWGANTARNREAIRTAIYDRLIQMGQSEDDLLDLNDLAIRPTVTGWSISISHAPEFGGYVVIKSPATVGLDLEDVSRVTAPITNRVSKPDELLSAPSAAHLWVAKEAAYKSCEIDSQPSLISEIHIGDWLSFDQNLELNRVYTAQPTALNACNSRGLWGCCAATHQNFGLGLALFFPQL